MNRIDEKFAELREKNRKALITFVTAGDPTLEATKNIIFEMEKKGADIIELGIPYSDPVAEGPVIQAANERALRNGIRIANIMSMVKDIRKETNIPLIYLLYFNCILQYGIAKFFKDCAQSGIDGLIIPDLPYEELDEIKDVANENGISIITLVSPTSRERMEKIVKNARGFLYCVSSLGVTGMRNEFSTDFKEFFSSIRKFSSVPAAIGFGIATQEHIRSLKQYSEGLIVGSAIVKQIEISSTIDEAVSNVGRFVMELRQAMDE